MHDLAIVIVSSSDPSWLRPCLRTALASAGDLRLDVVVADNGVAGVDQLVGHEFPQVRVVHCANRGFAHGNNRAVETTDARYVLFLNPDTETVDGTYADLVAAMDARPEVGVAGVRQVTADGTLWPTMRRFPSPVNALGDALGLERWARRPRWAGERELDLGRYDEERDCDWMTGAFLLVRREVLDQVGLMDERFFLYCEEPDLCRRVKAAGWSVRHLPSMTIVHHAGKAGVNARLAAQEAFSRRLYARKHFGPVARAAYVGAVALGHGVRSVARRGSTARAAEVAALRAVLGLAPPPFGIPAQLAA